MKPSDAVKLIEPAIGGHLGSWADFGAGDGTFTRALVTLVGSRSTVYAVDRDQRSLTKLAEWAARHAPNVIPVHADLQVAFTLPGLEGAGLDGALCANALHFFRDPGPVLQRLAARLRPGGRFVLVEYDGREANPWVPYPMSREALPILAASAGLTIPVIVASTPSRYGGALYVAAADRR